MLRTLDEREETDVALPVARGYPQPLAAAYRVRLAPRAGRLVKEDRLLDSVLNVNTPADYEEARARPAPPR